MWCWAWLPAVPGPAVPARQMTTRAFTFANGTLVTTNAHLTISSSTSQPWKGSEAVLRQPQPGAELQSIYSMECLSYPADEAASEEKLQFRLEHAPEYFRAMYSTTDSKGASEVFTCCAKSLIQHMCCGLRLGCACNCRNRRRGASGVHLRHTGPG